MKWVSRPAIFASLMASFYAPALGNNMSDLTMTQAIDCAANATIISSLLEKSQPDQSKTFSHSASRWLTMAYQRDTANGKIADLAFENATKSLAIQIKAFPPDQGREMVAFLMKTKRGCSKLEEENRAEYDSVVAK